MATNSDTTIESTTATTTKPSLLLIDDDPLIADSLAFVLQDVFSVYTTATRQQTRKTLQGLDDVPSLALVDLGLPPTPHAPEEGYTLISELLAFNPSMKILVLSGQSDKANIQHALTLGAVDFIPKPCDVNLLKTRLDHQLMILEAEQQQAVKELHECGLLGKSSAMEMLRTQITQFAGTPFPILIDGESGSGKELVAQCLHDQSERGNKPFLTINCAAFPAELLESQLFGHTKGAFTGASKAHTGFFEAAGKGTLFLDEIGDMPPSLQSKLLRVLENGEYYRLGETQIRRSDARVFAATNQDLHEAIRVGRFRQDLYHRLSVLTINVPPLRERKDDCLLLLDHFRQVYAERVAPFSLDEAAEQRWRNYPFNGNVRELRNLVIRLGAKYPGKQVSLKQLEAEMETAVIEPFGDEDVDAIETVKQQIASGKFNLDEALQDRERRYISAALEVSNGNLSHAARLLGVNRTTLHSRIQRLSNEQS